MRHLIIAVTALYGIASYAADKDVLVINEPASPVPVVVQNTPMIVEYRYVGLTTVEDAGLFAFGGLFGIAAMNKACASEFPGSRAASINEAYFRDDTDTRLAWVVPQGPMIAATNLPIATSPFSAVDAITGTLVGFVPGSGDCEACVLAFAYCSQYTSEAGRGPVSTGDGRVVEGNCSFVLPVACSAPVAIRAQ